MKKYYGCFTPQAWASCQCNYIFTAAADTRAYPHWKRLYSITAAALGLGYL